MLVVEPASQSLVSIRGVVAGTGGGPLEGVRIEAIGLSITAVTDAKGAYALRVPAGARLEQTTLRFRRTGYRDRRWVMAEGRVATTTKSSATSISSPSWPAWR